MVDLKTMEHENITDSIIKNMLIKEGRNLSEDQLKTLKETLQLTLSKYQIKEDYTKAELIDIQEENAMILRDFINSKRIEGRSDSTLYQYAKEVSKL